MWPKMLIELLPHLSRLVPMWDKFLSSKAASDKAAEAAMKALAEEVRSDLGQVTAAHAALYRHLQDQGAQITALAEDLRLARLAAEQAEAAARRLESSLADLTVSAKRVVAALVAVALLILVSIVLQLLQRRPV